jgi:SAM-dependent methyltransferase
MQRRYSPEEVHLKVSRRYAEISCSIKERFRYPTGRKGAELFGYEPSLVERIPEEVIEHFCGVGNPFVSGEVRAGETVLDVGCGGGVDLIIAAISAGPEGRVVGIDLVPEMVMNARASIEKMGFANCEVMRSGSESLPFEDNGFDVVISNGALYLSPLKEQTFSEIHRVLKPGGRFQFADVVLKEDLPESVARFFDGWSG